MLATACGAVSSLLIVFADDVAMPGMIHWLMGDLDSVNSLEAVGAILGLWLAVWIIVAKYAPQIHLLQFGFDKAKSLGVDVKRLQWLMVLLVALASAGAVSIAGAIGFIGLLVPHLIRLMIAQKHGVDQVMILNMSALAGGIVLVIADAIARTILAPAQLPVGVITVLLGVPAFLWLLAKMSTWGESRS
jgi:iron complex transport system permease protein